MRCIRASISSARSVRSPTSRSATRFSRARAQSSRDSRSSTSAVGQRGGQRTPPYVMSRSRAAGVGRLPALRSTALGLRGVREPARVGELVAVLNTGLAIDAYRAMLARGFRTFLQRRCDAAAQRSRVRPQRRVRHRRLARALSEAVTARCENERSPTCDLGSIRAPARTRPRARSPFSTRTATGSRRSPAHGPAMQ